MKVVCISDTHGMEEQLDMPSGDLLIHSGDITNVGELGLLSKFNDWLGTLDFEKIVVIPGNHDKSIPTDPSASKLLTNCDFLIDSFAIFRGLKIYGSPWTPWFGGHYWVYNRKRGQSIMDAWIKIPTDTDILVTHGPPYGILDNVPRTPLPQGCEELLKVVKKIRPKLHVFGHLHLQGGQQRYLHGADIRFVNAAVCTEEYKPENPIVVVDVEE